VCDQETLKNEEAKARYWAVENTTRWVVTPGKQTTNKQTNIDRATLNLWTPKKSCYQSPHPHT
jgi:hypothetical protein